jgi:hypothetical protein
MTLAISDTEVTPVNFEKIQSGDPFDFQKLYRKFYNLLLHETTLLLNNPDQVLALVQLSCIQSWINCENITSEQYYAGYIRNRILRYVQILSRQEDRINHELQFLKEIVLDRYALSEQHLARLCVHLTISQKALVRRIFKSYYQPMPGNLPAANHQTLLRYAFYTLHYIILA